ncbi:MAG: hypothetical protein K2K72_04115, partial [Duncaniella sp.]|nr:hypothetical protein [Duncaniella sp.]
RNSVTNDDIYLGDRLFLSRSINSRYNSYFENSFDLGLDDFHGFGANLSLDLTLYESAGSGWKHTLTSLGGTAYVWWNKGPYTISYWRTLPAKYLSGHYVGKQENGDALEFQWMPDKHWSFEVDWMYMFDKKGSRYPSWDYSSVNPSSSTRYIKNNSNMVVLSVKYTADFGSIFRSARRKLNNSDSGSSLLQL